MNSLTGRSSRAFLVLLPVCLLLAWQSASSPAAQGLTEPLSTLADSSALIVTGRVVSIGTQADGAAIYTYVTLATSAVLKGESLISVAGAPAHLVIKQMGGALRDVGLHVAGQATFTPDEEVLVFLAVRPRDRTLYTAGLAQGKFSLVDAGGTATRDGMSVSLDEVRSVAALSMVQPDSFIPVPPEILIGRPQFSFLPVSEGGPARWHEADDGVRVNVDYQIPPGGLAGTVNELDAAIAAWNGVNTRLVLQQGGSGGAVCPISDFAGDGRIALYWNDPCGEIGDGDSSTFGVGGGYYTAGFQKTINGTTFNKFLQGLAILNNAGPHRSTTACMRDAVTHVLGHAVGLGHSGDGNAVMFATLRAGCSTGASGLGNDDIAGLQAIYPAVASGGSPPLAPTAMTNNVSLDTVTLNWTPATSGGPAQSYIIEAGPAPGQTFVTFINGTSTTLVVGAVPTGVYYVRVRARNALGTSNPSPETKVTVGPCTAPGPPTNLAALIGDNNVTLSWLPPATTVAQGYTLFAGTAPGLSNALVAPLPATPSFFGVAPFGNYYVRIASRNSCGTSAPTADLLVSVQPCTAAPGAPTNLAFTKNGSAVTLSWTAPAGPSGPARYVLLVGSTTGGSDLLVQATTSNATTFSAIAPNGTFFVRVQGQNACGSSGASNEVVIAIP